MIIELTALKPMQINFLADNVLCGRCAPGSSRVGNKCKQCDDSAAGAVWFGFIVLSVLWVVLLLFMAGHPGTSSKKKIFFYFVQTLRIVLGPSSSWLVCL